MSQDQSNSQGYDQISSQQENQDMGGGAGVHGSGVAGGHQGQSATEKQDWLDKGIQGIGKKFGVNVSEQNADKAGDFANKEFSQKEGRGLPGVQ